MVDDDVSPNRLSGRPCSGDAASTSERAHRSSDDDSTPHGPPLGGADALVQEVLR
ncbi:hypothetical protein HMPREF0321_0163 [Dermacoccus sp. Ellin185]|nr:hypothetical protein HMPREF0321_0163 [Dermacoccus sp. Ellin185]